MREQNMGFYQIEASPLEVVADHHIRSNEYRLHQEHLVLLLEI